MLPIDKEECSGCIRRLVKKSLANETAILLNKGKLMINVRIDSPNYRFDFGDFNLIVEHIRNYIIIVDQYDDLIKIIESGFLSEDGKFIILVSETIDSDDLHSYLYEHYVYNAYIITNCTEIYKIHSNTGISHLNVDLCSKNATLTFDAYPKKFLNRTLNGILLDLHLPLPYIGDPSSNLPGVMIHPLRLLTEKYGIKFDLKSASVEREERFIIKGIAEVEDDINSGNLDIIVFQPYRRLYTYQTVSVSDVVYYNPHIWLVPKPNKMPNFRVLISIFNWITWSMAFFVLILTVTLLYAHGKYRNDRMYGNYVKCLIDVYALNLSMGLSAIPNGFRLKSLFIIYILYAFHLSSFFQGKLSSVLTCPVYDSRILTLEQLADSQLEIRVIYHNISLVKDINTTIASRMASKMESLEEKNISINRPFYVINRRDVALSAFAGDLNLTDAYRTKLDIIKDAFLPDLEGTYQMKKRNPAMLTLNNVIRVIRECGLHVKWMNDMKIVNFLAYTQEDEVNGQIKLTFEHLEGPFILLGFGLAVGTVIFVIEIYGLRRFA